jgi:peptidyl-prolyl cis-trans isomerase C
MTRMFFRTHTLVAAAALAAAGAVSAAAAGQVLAEVGGRDITLQEFRQVLGDLRSAGNSAATIRTLTPAGRREILDAFVDRALYAQGARDVGLDAQPDVRAEIARATEEVLARAYLAHEREAFHVTDADVQRYYDRHRDELRTPQRVKARHIQVKTREEAEAVLARLERGEPFGDVARQVSTDATTRDKGGELGWVTPGVMVAPFDEALFSTKKGALSPIVHTTFGFHVIEIEDAQASQVPPLASIRNEVRQKLVAADLERLKHQLQTRHPVQIHADVLASMK